MGYLKILAAFALTIVIHEAGHALALTAIGHEFSVVFRLPIFVGLKTDALTSLPPASQSVISLAGPITNFLLATVLCVTTNGFRVTVEVIVELLRFVIQPWRFFDEVKSVVGVMKKKTGLHEAPFLTLLIIFGFGLGIVNLLPLSPLDGWKAVVPYVSIVANPRHIQVYEVISGMFVTLLAFGILISDIFTKE